MKKGWKIVFTIFLIVVVIGIVGVGVGMLTGAEFTRIYSVLDDQYHIDKSPRRFRQRKRICEHPPVQRNELGDVWILRQQRMGVLDRSFAEKY